MFDELVVGDEIGEECGGFDGCVVGGEIELLWDCEVVL